MEVTKVVPPDQNVKFDPFHLALTILVERAGGTIVVPNINEFAEKHVDLTIEINGHDQTITLTSHQSGMLVPRSTEDVVQ